MPQTTERDWEKEYFGIAFEYNSSNNALLEYLTNFPKGVNWCVSVMEPHKESLYQCHHYVLQINCNAGASNFLIQLAYHAGIAFYVFKDKEFLEVLDRLSSPSLFESPLNLRAVIRDGLDIIEDAIGSKNACDDKYIEEFLVF